MSHESGFRPTILTLTGPTCSGKSHLKELLVARGFRPVVSFTTRQPRAGEVDGVHYHFVTEEHFEAMEQSSAFLETVRFGGCRYGSAITPDLLVGAGAARPLVLVCEPKGAANIRAFCLRADWPLVQVFLDGSDELRARRFMGRHTQDIAACASEEQRSKTEDGYVHRLREIAVTEAAWRAAARSGFQPYELVVDQFDENTQRWTIQAILDRLGMAQEFAT